MKLRYVELVLLQCWYLMGLNTMQSERFKAECTMINWRRARRFADKARTERLHQELRGLLDGLSAELKSWRPDDWYEHQRFWNDADAEDRDAAMAEALEEWYAEQAEGEVEVAANEAEGEEEVAAEEAEGEEEKAAVQAEGEEELTAEQADGQEEEAVEQAAEQAEGEEEEAAEQAECEEEMEAEKAEGEQGSADDDLSLEAINALNKEADDAYDRAARERTTRQVQPGSNDVEPTPHKTKKATRIPEPTAASTRSPRNSRPVNRYK
jgi:hypothetical protein